ncbi:unnamed protein product [Prorocentrum cordatum]|uniref:PDEase domain-containing protein n=1 Tax=Prorocentrum cordatum TaxID=2364126 RepID=A0ABN9UQT0_9DINO|nr:unnamed protein product [Polarella glacialis]
MEELSFLLQNYSTHDSSAEADSHLQTSWEQHSKSHSGRGSLLSVSSAPSSDASGAEPEEQGTQRRADTPWVSTPSRKMRRTSTLLKMTDIRTLLDQAGTLHFDAIAFAGLPAVRSKPLQVLGQFLLEESGDVLEDLQKHGWVEDGDTFRSRLFQFLETIGSLYSREADHSCAHAVDVTSTMEWFVQMPFVTDRTTPLDHLMCLLAAAIHDVGHPGTNPLFHVTTMSELAIRYNDKSILENYHISLAFETMLKPMNNCNWFELLQKNFRQGASPCVNIQKYMRRGLVAMVLATDMSGHAKHVQKLHEIGGDEEAWLTVAPEGQEEEFVERKLFLLETVLHAADLSSPCRPRSIMLGWTQRVLAEFWSQGDEEIRLGLPVSPLCDRQAGLATVPKGQLGFLQFVVQPFYTQIAELMPEAQEATELMTQNKEFWENMEKDKATYDEIFPE